MLRRCSRLQRSQVQTSRPFSVPRVQVIAARAGSPATVPQVAHTGGGWVPGRLAHGYFFVRAASLAFAAALAACLNSRTLASDGCVDDVGDRAVGAVLGVGADGLLPPGRSHLELLADQRREDAGLLVAEPGQRLEPLDQVAGVLRLGPDRLGPTVVLVPHHGRQLLHPPGHRPAVAVDGRRRGAQVGERLRLGGGDRVGRQRAEPVEDLPRPAEGVLHRVLLVEQHPDEQGERVVAQHLVGGLVLGDPDLRSHADQPSLQVSFQWTKPAAVGVLRGACRGSARRRAQSR